MNFIAEPLQYLFMQKALLASIAVGIVCALLSAFVIFKGWSFLSDAISHAVLPGVVVATFAGFPIFIGAIIAGLSCAFFTNSIIKYLRFRNETALGIIFTTMLSIGVLFYGWLKPAGDVAHILFGNVLGIKQSVLIKVLIISLLAGLFILFKWKDLVLLIFDQNQMRLLGLSVAKLNFLLLILLVFVIVAAIEAVGAVLVAGLLIAPGMIGQLLCKNFSSVMIVSVISAIISSIIGVYFSYYLNASTGASIVLTQGFLFTIALIYQRLTANS